ncbi:MAG: AAA family ATPase [Phycisphaerales bacterium]
MNDRNQIERYILAGHSCVRVSTMEELEMLLAVRETAMKLRRPVLQWSVVHGVHDGLVVGASPVPNTENAAAALYHFATVEIPTVFITLDLAAHLDDDRTRRAWRNLIEKLREGHTAPGEGSTLIMIDHTDKVPSVVRSHSITHEPATPSEQHLTDLVGRTLRRLHRQSPIQVDIGRKALGAVVRSLAGLSERQIEQVIIDTVTEDRTFNSEDFAGILVRKRRLLQADGALEAVEAPTSMDQIGGLKNLKRWLNQRRKALSDEAIAFGIAPPRGVLLLGVQGAGKSLCAKAVATAWQLPLLRLDAGSLYDKYIGESERRLRQALNQAKQMAPVVLWIDEIEKGFASAASNSTDGGLSKRLFGTLLTWMQERTRPIFLVATANDIEALPPELLRKGRFDEIFFVDLPNPEARREIFSIHLAKRKRDPKSFDLKALADASNGFSGAEIEQAIQSALHNAFSAKGELNTEHLVSALHDSPPLSVTMRERIDNLREWSRGRCVSAD